MLMKELKINTQRLNERRNILCSWMGRLNRVKMSVTPKLIHRFSVILPRSQQVFFFFFFKAEANLFYNSYGKAEELEFGKEESSETGPTTQF